MKLYITYRDFTGLVMSEVEYGSVDFADGYAFVDCDGVTHKIPVSDIVSIAMA